MQQSPRLLKFICEVLFLFEYPFWVRNHTSEFLRRIIDRFSQSRQFGRIVEKRAVCGDDTIQGCCGLLVFCVVRAQWFKIVPCR